MNFSQLYSRVFAHIALPAKNESGGEFELLANSLPVQVWTATPQGVVDYLNRRCNLYFNRLTHQITGKGWQEQIHPDDIARTLELWKDSLATGADFEIEVRLRRFGGQYRWHLCKAVAHRGAAGEILKWYGSNTDIHDRKLSEKLLEEQRAKMISGAKMSELGEMASGIAHEINNPLAIIHGRAGLLRDALESGTADTARMIQAVEKIESTALRISKIVKALRALSRSGENDPFEVVSVRGIVEDTLELCRERFRIQGIQFFFDNVDTGLAVSCRQVQVAQVLLNLLNNAYDAILPLEAKWVRIIIQDLGEMVQFSVMDSGGGIHPEYHEKIMQPFFTTKEVGKGTGLGLSVSLGIIDGHGGVFEYVPASANTLFRFTLPKKHAAQSERQAS